MHAESAPAPSAPSEGLPDLTQVPPDERDRVWFNTYYQGDKVPQLTVRAVLMGGAIGMLMSVSNLYLTLKIGWAFGVAITACVLSYTIWNGLVSAGLAKTKMSILENNCMQSTASAAGYSTGGTLATAAGAMLLINHDAGRMDWFTLTCWVFLVAILGVFIAIPMKRQMINQEQLPFPSGIAAAETLKSLYAEGEAATKKASALIDALIFGGIYGLARSFGILPAEIPFVGDMLVKRLGPDGKPSETTVSLGSLQGLTFEPSVLLIAAGMIVGMKVSVSMMAGSILNYFILPNFIMALPDWQETLVGPTGETITKTFLGHYEIVRGESGSIDVVKITRWSLWLGTAMMVSSGLTSFGMSWRTVLRAFKNVGRKPNADDANMDAIEVPNSWMIMGLIPTSIGIVLLCWFSFHIAWWLGLVSIALSFVLALVASRATGETDTTPVGAMGKITQFTFALLAPKDITANLMTAGITAGAAGSSADLLTDLKSGYLLGANPKQQFIAQLSGVFFGTVSIIPAWYLLVPNEAALQKFNPPATNMWFAVAQALSNGIHVIPTSARYAIAIGALIGIILPLLESAFPKARPYLPSAMGLGLAFVVTFSNSLAFFIGAVIADRWAARDAKSAEDYIVPIASGAIAGESLAGVGYAAYSMVFVPLIAAIAAWFAS